MKHLVSIRLFFAVIFATLIFQTAEAASKVEPAFPAEEYGLANDHYAKFPIPLSEYEKTPMGAAIRKAIAEAVVMMVEQTPQSYYKHP